MKKLLIFILILSCSMPSIGQTYIHKDTTFLGYLARISYISGNTDSTNLILIMHGNGEVGSVTNNSQVYGPHYWINNGFNGAVTLANGVHYPVYVTLQQPATYTRPWDLKAKVDAIITRFKVKYGGLHAMGLSAGGWAWTTFATYKPTANDYTYYQYFRTITNIQGVYPGDPYHSSLLDPMKFGNMAVKNPKFKFVGFEQVNDNRGISYYVKNMIDSTSATNRFFMYWTNFGSSGHGNFNDFYNPSTTNWTMTNPDVQLSNGGSTNTLPFAGGQNIYQWALRQSEDTTIPVAGSVVANAGTAQTINLPTTSITLTGSATLGTAPYTYLWVKTFGTGGTITSSTNATTTVTGLSVGTYTFQLQVTDATAGTSNNNVTITVKYSDAYLAVTSTDATIDVGTNANLTSSLSPNHNIVSTQWSKLSSRSKSEKS